MSICKAAHYYFAFEVDEKANCCDYSLEHADVVKATLISALDRICARKSIVIQRTTKKGNKQIDIRPLIYSIEKPVMHGREIGIESILSVGNKGSVRPEEIFRILSEFAGIKLYPTGIHRKELLIEQDGKLVPPFLEN